MPRNLENWLDGFMAMVENSEPPDSYKKWIAISCVAACMQRKVYLNWGYVTFYPNMYIVLVGPPGRCRKGTAMGPGYHFLRELGIKMAAESITREALIRELKTANASQTNPETGEIFLHSSLTIYSPELTVFLGYNNLALMSDLTDWYDCRDRWTYRTKNMGTDDIVGVWVNLIGATTPDLIQSSMPLDAIGGGLTSRMIFIYEDKKGKIVPDPFIDPAIAELRVKLLQDLEQISLIQGEFRVTANFLERWVDWYTAQEHNPPFNDPRFAGYIERRPTHILKLCMIMNAMRHDGRMIITEKDFESALTLLREAEVKMPRTFGGVGESSSVRITNKVLEVLATVKVITREDLLNQFYHDADKFVLDKIIETLSGMGAIRLEHHQGGKITLHYIWKRGEQYAD